MDLPDLAFGTAPLASIFWGNEEGRAVAALARAMEAGVRMFDTAPLYGMGESETRLGQALRETDARPIIATKVGRTDVFDYSRDAVLRSLDTSRERLGVERLDIVHIHDPDNNLADALDQAFPTLVELRDSGEIGAVSLGTMSIATAEHFLEHAELDCLMLATRLSLLDDTGAAVAKVCHKRGIPFIAAAIFNSGVLARPEPGAWFDYAPADEATLKRVRELASVCEEHGVSLREAALHYPRTVQGVTTTVVGMASADEVDDNLRAWATPPPEEIWADLSIG